VVAGEVRGVGYSTLTAQRAAAWVHRSLRVPGRVAPWRVGDCLARTAESVWCSASSVHQVGCSTVVLALDPRYWEFVGPAVWAAARTADRAPAKRLAPPRARAVRSVAEPARSAPAQPELSVRRWCAAQESVPDRREELRVDDATRSVLVGPRRVPGLLSAVPVLPGAPAAGGEFAAAERAGRCAVAGTRRSGERDLLSVV
jgi:hypothetical protein